MTEIPSDHEKAGFQTLVRELVGILVTGQSDYLRAISICEEIQNDLKGCPLQTPQQMLESRADVLTCAIRDVSVARAQTEISRGGRAANNEYWVMRGTIDKLLAELNFALQTRRKREREHDKYNARKREE
jgi:hypothetical protein